jgi:septal ring factor EnvC (AmiA/AmiB activator)
VVKDPSQSDRWTQENYAPDRTGYNVFYNTPEGQDAAGHVKVFVKYKDTPSGATARSWAESELKGYVRILAGCEEMMRQQQAILRMARDAMEGQQSTEQNVAQLRQSLNELQERHAELARNVTALNNAQRTTEDQIVDNAARFTFLRDYLELSQDKAMADRGPVARFLTLDERYRASAAKPDKRG